jgi:hypothetical protein
MRVLVATKPKSGTHLMGNILQNLGISNSNFLLFSNHFEDYKGFYIYDGIRYSRRLNAPLTSPAKNIKDNSYVLAHIFYDEENAEIFKDFKKINIFRDNDEVRKSANRFRDQSNWDLTDEMLNKIDLWSTEPGILNIRFEDMINKDIETIDKIQIHLFGQIKFDSKYIIEKSLKDDSYSKSSLRD